MTASSLPLAVYGTLLDDEVRALVMGPCRGRRATLAGWERVFVAGQTYPGIRECAGASIDVLVLSGLSARALAGADRFEGNEYTREVVSVRLVGAEALTQTMIQAMIYVPTARARLSDRAWRYDSAWRAQHRVRFLAMTKVAVGAAGTVVR